MGKQKSQILNPKSSFRKDIDFSLSTLKRINKRMNLFMEKIDEGQFESALRDFSEIERLSEKLTNINRLLLIQRGIPALSEMAEKHIEESSNIAIKYENEIFHINMGILLPKKEKGDPKYIRANLIRALDNYFYKNERILYREKSIIVFVHNYSKERNYREYRDYDNIEINSVVDAIALFTLVDDSPYLLDHFYFSREAEQDSTDIFIIKKTAFGEWLNANYNNRGVER